MKKILITANSSFAIWNFRKRLVDSFLNTSNVYISVPEEVKDSSYEINPDITLCNLPMNSRSKGIFSNLNTLISCFFQLLRIRPDIVLSFTIKNNIYFGILCRILKINFIANITGVGSYQKDCNSFQLVVINCMYKFALKKAKHIFFQNLYDMETFITSNFVNNENCSVIPGSGIDLNSFEFIPAYQASKNSFTFTFASRLLLDKGIQEFIDAAKDILKNNSYAVNFVICGSHDEEDERYIDKTCLEEIKSIIGIDYLGNSNEMKKIISNSSCIVLPSYYNEGVPRILIESLAIGRPIITTNRPGCKDTILENQTGFLVNERDSMDLKHQMIRMIELPYDKYETMTIASREHAKNNFSDEIIILDYHSIINS